MTASRAQRKRAARCAARATDAVSISLYFRALCASERVSENARARRSRRAAHPTSLVATATGRTLGPSTPARGLSAHGTGPGMHQNK